MTQDSRSGVTADRWTYAGLFAVTLATLMFEILLTRIFSVTMWYHFAFVAISIAMFGMTVGALIVYLFAGTFSPEKAKAQMAMSALLFAMTSVAAFLVHVEVPFLVELNRVAGLANVVLTYVVVAVPFLFSGICVCLALTRFPDQVGRLYAADLAGAALGCILLIVTLNLTDGPASVFIVAAFAAVSAFLFAVPTGKRCISAAAILVAAVFAAVAAFQAFQADRQAAPRLRLKYTKGRTDPFPLYEKWNSFSRVDIRGEPDTWRKPFCWGLSEVAPDTRVQELGVHIDAGSGTIMTRFDGHLQPLEYLKYDIVNTVHHLRSDADIAVIGAGGGRDVLSAMLFDQHSVEAIEINGAIVEAVTKRFADFTGHLDRDPRVRFVTDEARSYLARHKGGFDIIQVSLIDTWAATVAGAYVLSESSLYTADGWEIFMGKLTPRGILTFSRWYFRERPGEIYRLVSLATEALKRIGVNDTRGHIIVVRNMSCRTWLDDAENVKDGPEGIGTILVAREPFTAEDVDKVESLCRDMHFEVVVSPRTAIDDTFETIANGKHLDRFYASYPLNVAPPTDDSPFFFHMLRLRSIFNGDLHDQGQVTCNVRAVVVLGTLLVTVLGLTFLCIVIPLILTTKAGSMKGSLPLFMLFIGIGLGFMLVEISQMQRLIVFLGHPTYGLAVVLFSLLLSSSLGSLFSQRFIRAGNDRAAMACLLLLLGALVVFGAWTPHVTQAYRSSVTPVRIGLAITILLPLGFFMGMPFPLGMRVAAGKTAAVTPWLFGINGAMSVCASVLAVVIAMSSSISTAFWVGFSCYVVAVLSYAWSVASAAKTAKTASVTRPKPA
ncbi:MAG TPA: hypothetical protein PLO37_04495 [Candidatus Hydrogenedentes bacterium]|nr:hypothetical protein [Candidatus Hydrogenedentota bacterium]HPG66084.1 hypothetical protein [Candidatus Hydrogenedentota bacterium]